MGYVFKPIRKYMKDVQKLRRDSALLNVGFAFIYLTVLMIPMFVEFGRYAWFFYGGGLLSSLFYGALLSNWYCSFTSGKVVIEPYIATVVICFLSSVTTAVICFGIVAVNEGTFVIVDVFKYGLVSGFGVGVFLLPITLPVGAAIGWKLKKRYSFMAR